MKTVDSRDQKPSGRFSLYLSSQLLYGVTKVFQQQVIIFIKDLERAKKELVQIKMQDLRRFRTEDALELLQLPEIPTPTFPPLREDVHLLREAEEPEPSSLRCLMEGFDTDLNFGALTEQQIEEYYGSINNELLEIPSARKHVSDPLNIEVPLETSFPLPEIDSAQSMHNIGDILTPTKREPAQQAGTPSKRKRLTYDEDMTTRVAHSAKVGEVVVPMEINSAERDMLQSHTLTVPNISDLPPPEISTDVTTRPVEQAVNYINSLQLEVLEEDEAFHMARKKKSHKGLLIDSRTELKDSDRVKWLSDINIATKDLSEVRVDLYTLYQTPAGLFNLPSKMVKSDRKIIHYREYWYDLYQDIIEERKKDLSDERKKKSNVIGTEYGSIEVPRTQDTMSQEPEITNKSKDLIVEQSKKEMTVDTTDPSKIIERSLALRDDQHTGELKDFQEFPIQPDSIDINITHTSHCAQILEDVNEGNVFASALDSAVPEEIKTVKDKRMHEISEEKSRFTSSASGSNVSTVSDGVQWTRQDLLAILEVHWKEVEHVNFVDVVQLEANNQEDAVICFEFLLECVREGKLTLHQEDLQSPLYIQKRR